MRPGLDLAQPLARIPRRVEEKRPRLGICAGDQGLKVLTSPRQVSGDQLTFELIQWLFEWNRVDVVWSRCVAVVF